MHARKIAVSLFALALGITLAGFAAASPDSPATAPATPAAPQAAEKACCKHHDAAGDKTGMHCDHAKMKAQGEEGKACCAQHASIHKAGAAPADAQASCAKHAEMMKGDASADTKACCAQHAARMKDGDKSGCCCCGDETCPHHAAEGAPAKS
jgi:hypothetical protein